MVLVNGQLRGASCLLFRVNDTQLTFEVWSCRTTTLFRVQRLDGISDYVDVRTNRTRIRESKPRAGTVPYVDHSLSLVPGGVFLRSIGGVVNMALGKEVERRGVHALGFVPNTRTACKGRFCAWRLMAPTLRRCPCFPNPIVQMEQIQYSHMYVCMICDKNQLG